MSTNVATSPASSKAESQDYNQVSTEAESQDYPQVPT